MMKEKEAGKETVSAIEGIEIDVAVVLGTTSLPIRQILGMSRGAMIALDCSQDDPSLIYANNRLVARGQVQVDGDRMSIEITDIVRKGG